MKYLLLDDGKLKASQISLGCMRIYDKPMEELESLIETALKEGINFFDHADIYGQGKSEEVFGELLKKHPDWRNQMILQTKCGIRRGDRIGYYCFDKDYILSCVDKSLARLQTDHVEILLLHRPDTLMDPKEVGAAFDQLYKEGKVKYFGVSNMNPMQIKLIQKYCSHKIMFNQMQFNPVNSGMIDNGVNVNMRNDASIDHDGSILEYCRLEDITLQAWSILQASWEEGTFLNKPTYKRLNDCLQKHADIHHVTPAAIVTAWILHHPANIQPIAGTTNAKHLEELCKACDVKLSNQDWYEIYMASEKTLP